MSSHTFGPAAVALAAALTSVLAAPPEPPAKYDWRMFGGGPGRNMVNLAARRLPEAFSVEPGPVRNMKWTAKLGSRAYGGPVVAGGRVYVGTNNQSPRNPR